MRALIYINIGKRGIYKVTINIVTYINFNHTLIASLFHLNNLCTRTCCARLKENQSLREQIRFVTAESSQMP